MSRLLSKALVQSGDSQPSNAAGSLHGVPLWKWAACASVPVLAYVLIPGKKNSRSNEETGFDAFLVKQGAVPTGVVGQTPSKPKASASKAHAREHGGPFECFLLADGDGAEEEDVRNPLDFSSFLLTAKGDAAKQPRAQHENPNAALPAASEQPTLDMARVLVLYGTEYGFSREIAELLAGNLKETKAFWPTIVDMASQPSGMDLSQEQAVLVACSTQGDGVPPTEAREFCDWLFAGKAGPLQHLKFSVCALGDRSYTHYCKCGKSIDAAFEKAGAQRFVPRQDVNKEDWKAVNDWIAAVVAALPTLGLKTIGQLGGSVDSPAAASAAPTQRPWGKSRPYPASVIAIEGLCNISSKDDKNTIRVEFDLGDSGMAYLPGDALGIYPTNSPEVVKDTLTASGLDAATPISVPSHHYEDSEHVKGGTMPLSSALAKCFDLRSPKPDIFKLLASLQPTANGHANGHTNGHANGHANGHTNGTQDSNGSAKVPSLSTLQEGGEAQEAYLAVRHVADVLRDFLPQGATLTADQLTKVLRPLQPRLYSISSSPLEHPQRVQATIAEVKYETLGRDRIGVCSTYISQRLAVGQTVPVFISKNPDFRLPEQPGKPIIMVGPGTGLAPFRSFIKHRLLESSSSSGPMVLYFGCRRSDQDYLYRPLLEEWAEKGSITLFKAFSRETASKVYVQQRLRESADLVWRLLHEQGGHFYVCGDASSMAGAVEKELLAIFEARLGKGPEAAAQYLERLSQEHRYERDVWV